MTRHKSRTQKPDPEFDSEGQVDVEATIWEREYAYGPPTSYRAPQPADKMKALYAIGLEPLSKSAKAVFTVLVWHANSKNGRCDPGQARIAYETNLSLRSVKRAIIELRSAGFIYRTRRGAASNAYQIQWHYVRSIFDEFEERVKVYRSEVTELSLSDWSAETENHMRGQNCHLGGDRTVTSQVTGLSPKPIKRTHKENPCPERADCASRNTADVIPFQEKRSKQGRVQASDSECLTPSVPEEAWAAMETILMEAAKRVKQALSDHPRKKVLMEEMQSSGGELYLDAIREEAMGTGLGNVFLWSIIRSLRAKALITSSVRKVPV